MPDGLPIVLRCADADRGAIAPLAPARRPDRRWRWLAAGASTAALLGLAVACSTSESEAPDPGAIINADKGSTPARSEIPAADDNDDDNAPAPPGGDVHDAPPPNAPSPVLAAIQRRSVRALDILLVAREPGGIAEWTQADGYCKGLVVDGLADWRLPELGELRSLGSAGMLRATVTYWSATPADSFGDAYLGWYPKRRRVADSLSTAQTLCVRGDRADT